jgi:hypothetical protein
VAADVNGDGIPDLITANAGSNSVSVLLGDGNGSFQAAHNCATGVAPQDVAVADVNGDGIPDLVVANRLSNSVSVLLGNGNGTFQKAKNFAIGPTPVCVVVADVNNDGHPDLITANVLGDTLSVLLGNGNGTFAAAQNFRAANGLGPFGPYAVAVADVNGDGHLDLIVADNAKNVVSVLLGNGDGTFEVPQDFATGQLPRAVVVADVNGDGKLDLVVANGGSNSVSVLLGNGDGTFAAARNFAVGKVPYAVAVTDVSGDGRPDLITANCGSNNVTVLLGRGNGSFSTAQNYSAGPTPDAVAVADLDGDGHLDLVVSNRKANTVSVLLHAAGALVPQAKSNLVATTRAVPVVEMVDAVVGSVGDRDVSGNPDDTPNRVNKSGVSPVEDAFPDSWAVGEARQTTVTAARARAVDVLYSTHAGLSAVRDPFWDENRWDGSADPGDPWDGAFG